MASSYRNIHPVDEVLSNIVVEAVPSDDQLIADKVCESIPIYQRSGTLLLEETRNFMGAGAGLDLERAPGASRVTIGGFDRSSLTFRAKSYSADEHIAMEDIRDSQYPGAEEQRTARKVGRVMKLAREERFANVLFDSTAFATSTPAIKFNAAGAEPLTFLHELKDTLFKAAHGINPDSLIFGRDVFRQLARNPEIRGYVGSTSNGLASGNRILNDDMVISVLRDVLGIPNIHVGQALKDNAVPGAASNEAYIWNGETIFMGILRGSDSIVQKSGTVRAMPVAALNFELGLKRVSGQYDSIDGLRRTVWADEEHVVQAIDSTLGHVVTDCLT